MRFKTGGDWGLEQQKPVIGEEMGGVFTLGEVGIVDGEVRLQKVLKKAATYCEL